MTLLYVGLVHVYTAEGCVWQRLTPWLGCGSLVPCQRLAQQTLTGHRWPNPPRSYGSGMPDPAPIVHLCQRLVEQLPNIKTPSTQKPGSAQVCTECTLYLCERLVEQLARRQAEQQTRGPDGRLMHLKAVQAGIAADQGGGEPPYSSSTPSSAVPT